MVKESLGIDRFVPRRTEVQRRFCVDRKKPVITIFNYFYLIFILLIIFRNSRPASASVPADEAAIIYWGLDRGIRGFTFSKYG